jgi:SAM-dependent methyltransferase
MKFDSFTAERLQRLAEIERWHFWFAGRRALIGRLLDRYVPSGPCEVLDAGCGTGATLEGLAARGFKVVGFDMRLEGLRATAQAIPEAGLFQADGTRLPLASESFDAALALDVLEHVDDHAMMAELTRVLRPGAHLILTVPALPMLWSYRDEAAGHLRRYTARHLETVLIGSGIQVLFMGYYQFFLLPLVLATRVLGRKNAAWRETEDLPSALVNRILTLINLMEVRLGRFLRWPFGSSLVAVCQKRERVNR